MTTKRKKTGGRVAGTPNHVTSEVKALAQQYVPAVIAELYRLVRHAESEPARVSAAAILLDRAAGKVPQGLTDGDGGALIPATVIHQHVGLGDVPE